MPHLSKSICVYCGSRDGDDPAFRQAATDTGRMIADNSWRLVYGAGDIGLMGAVARAAQSAGGATFGVIPQHLMKHEVGKRDLTTLVVTEDMHERKKVMYMNSDAIVVLPGGAGTLDELFEVVTWRQLGLHRRPVFLLNIAGFWQPLIDLFDHICTRGFAPAETRDFITPVDDVAGLEAALKGSLAGA